MHDSLHAVLPCESVGPTLPEPLWYDPEAHAPSVSSLQGLAMLNPFNEQCTPDLEGNLAVATWSALSYPSL